MTQLFRILCWNCLQCHFDLTN